MANIEVEDTVSVVLKADGPNFTIKEIKDLLGYLDSLGVSENEVLKFAVKTGKPSFGIEVDAENYAPYVPPTQA